MGQVKKTEIKDIGFGPYLVERTVSKTGKITTTAKKLMHSPRSFSNNWRTLTEAQKQQIFSRDFAGLTCLPDLELIDKLNLINSGYIEAAEDRTHSTVYRIPKLNFYKKVFEKDRIQDEPKTNFNLKPVVFYLEYSGDDVYLIRNKYQRFKALLENWAIKGIEWIDAEPPQAIVISILRKARSFLQYVYFLIGYFTKHHPMTLFTSLFGQFTARLAIFR